tara:strand:+ start:357 stop:899 length:543 start_codon:yes stop_codon:yes gene_type:complete
MIDFYKPNPKSTGTACSFYLNPKDNSFWGTMIKQASWDASRKRGSFKSNMENPQKNVKIKFNATEIAGFVDAIERNSEVSGYHGSNQVVRYKFGPYVDKSGKQIGFSYSVTKESKEDSTDKQSYIIGFKYEEARLMKVCFEHLLTQFFKNKISSFEPRADNTDGSTAGEITNESEGSWDF